MTDAPADGPANALVLFSGGQDSATCLAWALDRFARVETLGFQYGQRHAVELAVRPGLRDRIAALRPDWAARLGPDHVLDLTGALEAVAGTALTSDAAIRLREDGLPNTFVPGRNLLFLVYAAAMATRRGLDRVVGGMCQTDYSGYPDCRDDTIRAQAEAIALGFGQRIPVETPLMTLDKAQVWALARRLGGDDLVRVIVEHSHTCYLGDRGTRHAWGYGCGACPACLLRQSGWQRWRTDLPGSDAPGQDRPPGA